MNNNRVFKFRIWNKEYKDWIVEEDRGISGDGQILSYRRGGMFPGWITESKQDNYIIQQFTGLLDKNNKEIYEGDIIEIIWHKNTVLFGKVKWDLSDLTYTVFGENVATYLNLLKDIEIKGNIFQTPDLLK